MARSRVSPLSCSQGVVMTTASGFASRMICSAVLSLSSLMAAVRLRMMQAAFSIWFAKNSPKFFMYIFALEASTTVVKPLSTMESSSAATPCTALMTSDSLPTPEGSMRMRSGWYCAMTCLRASLKSPTREQQMQPEFISVISMPASFRKPPSTEISPNSFSMSTSFSFL